MGITGDQLLEVFAAYNQQIWPMQIVAYLLGVVGLILAIRRTPRSSRGVTAVLAFFWTWVAFLFWLPSARQGFAPAYLFVAIFVVQGALFVAQAVRGRPAFGFQSNATSWAGIAIALYALVGYPLVGLVVGHVYPQAPPFGLTPCPLVAYTFGLLLLTRSRVPKVLLVLPFFYAVSGFYWATLGIIEDLGLALSGILASWLIWRRDAARAAAPTASSAPTAASAASDPTPAKAGGK